MTLPSNIPAVSSFSCSTKSISGAHGSSRKESKSSALSVLLFLSSIIEVLKTFVVSTCDIGDYDYQFILSKDSIKIMMYLTWLNISI